MTHRYEEGEDLDVHILFLHAAWESSGYKAGDALKLVCAVKQCFKQMLQVRLIPWCCVFNLPAMPSANALTALSWSCDEA